MANIKLELENPYNGQFITFTAPCGCDEVTDGLIINNKVYEIIDANGNIKTGVGGTWSNGAKISVILDTVNEKAYIQNGAVPDVDVTSSVPMYFSINENGGLRITYDDGK